MKKTSIYVDTSVIGGCCDSEFKEWSRGLLSDFQSRKFSLLLSELTDAEIQDAPDEVKNAYIEFRECTDSIFLISPEAIELADAYLNHNILTQNYRNDAFHIAIATIVGADLLVSWNFKHIVHFEKMAHSTMKCNTWESRKENAILSVYGKPIQTSNHDRKRQNNRTPL